MSELRDRVGRVICRTGGMTWDDQDLSASTRRVTQEAYRTLADAAIAEVLAWQSEQAVAAAGPDPFLEIAFPGAVPNGDGTFRVKKPSMSGSIQPSSQPIPEDRQL